MNWIIICVAYPIVVKPDAFIGIVYFLGLIITIISFIGIVCVNEFILKRKVVKDNRYYLTFFYSFLSQINYPIYAYQDQFRYSI